MIGGNRKEKDLVTHLDFLGSEETGSIWIKLD